MCHLQCFVKIIIKQLSWLQAQQQQQQQSWQQWKIAYTLIHNARNTDPIEACQSINSETIYDK